MGRRITVKEFEEIRNSDRVGSFVNYSKVKPELKNLVEYLIGNKIYKVRDKKDAEFNELFKGVFDKISKTLKVEEGTVELNYLDNEAIKHGNNTGYRGDNRYNTEPHIKFKAKVDGLESLIEVVYVVDIHYRDTYLGEVDFDVINEKGETTTTVRLDEYNVNIRQDYGSIEWNEKLKSDLAENGLYLDERLILTENNLKDEFLARLNENSGKYLVSIKLFEKEFEKVRKRKVNGNISSKYSKTVILKALKDYIREVNVGILSGYDYTIDNINADEFKLNLTLKRKGTYLFKVFVNDFRFSEIDGGLELDVNSIVDIEVYGDNIEKIRKEGKIKGNDINLIKGTNKLIKVVENGLLEFEIKGKTNNFELNKEDSTEVKMCKIFNKYFKGCKNYDLLDIDDINEENKLGKCYALQLSDELVLYFNHKAVKNSEDNKIIFTTKNKNKDDILKAIKLLNSCEGGLKEEELKIFSKFIKEYSNITSISYIKRLKDIGRVSGENDLQRKRRIGAVLRVSGLKGAPVNEDLGIGNALMCEIDNYIVVLNHNAIKISDKRFYSGSITDSVVFASKSEMFGRDLKYDIVMKEVKSKIGNEDILKLVHNYFIALDLRRKLGE